VRILLRISSLQLVLTSCSPLAMIMPAKSHPEVIVQAVSARDRKKAEAFAAKHGIPEVKDSYQGELQSLDGASLVDNL
jgi:predicted dehydrogenase